ncbi:MAG: exodeoxyribonuclease VII large subunit, partial [Bradyrhizobium sp.]
VCWQRGQESRRNELRAAARALPGATELLAIPRQRLDSAAATLPRALKTNTHVHFRRFAAASAKLTLRVLHGQIAQADHRLVVSSERLSLSSRALLHRRRERFEALDARFKASRFAYAQAKRQAISRERERTERLAERARRALTTSMSRWSARVDHAGQLLAALSYRSVLARGFALVRDETGHPLHQAASIGPGAVLSIEFADGKVAATAGAECPVPAAAPAAPRTARDGKPTAPKRSPDPADQGSLF